MSSGKIIGIVEGKVQGYSFDTEHGFLINGSYINVVNPKYANSNVLGEVDVTFPFNIDRPPKIDLESLRNRKFRLTIELLDDDTKTGI